MSRSRLAVVLVCCSGMSRCCVVNQRVWISYHTFPDRLFRAGDGGSDSTIGTMVLAARKLLGLTRRCWAGCWINIHVIKVPGVGVKHEARHWEVTGTQGLLAVHREGSQARKATINGAYEVLDTLLPSRDGVT